MRSTGPATGLSLRWCALTEEKVLLALMKAHFFYAIGGSQRTAAYNISIVQKLREEIRSSLPGSRRFGRGPPREFPSITQIANAFVDPFDGNCNFACNVKQGQCCFGETANSNHDQ